MILKRTLKLTNKKENAQAKKPQTFIYAKMSLKYIFHIFAVRCANINVTVSQDRSAVGVCNLHSCV